MSNAAKNFDILAISVLHNYFNRSTKSFPELYLAKFLNISAKSFFPYRMKRRNSKHSNSMLPGCLCRNIEYRVACLAVIRFKWHANIYLQYLSMTSCVEARASVITDSRNVKMARSVDHLVRVVYRKKRAGRRKFAEKNSQSSAHTAKKSRPLMRI